MNKVEQILNTKEKKIKESLKVFVKRKIKFEKETPGHNYINSSGIYVLKNSNEVMINSLFYKYNAIYNRGIISAFQMEPHEIKRIREGKGLNYNTSIFVPDSEYEIQHELQHVFDHLFLNFRENKIYETWELEYHSYLAQIIFSKNSEKALGHIENEVYRNLDALKCDLEDRKNLENMKLGLPHLGAKWEIVFKMNELLINETSEKTEVMNACMDLFNECYYKKIGLTYEQIIQQIKGM